MNFNRIALLFCFISISASASLQANQDPDYNECHKQIVEAEKLIADELRHAIGLRPVALRNKLIDIESKTGINLFLPDWVKGKIITKKTK